MLIFYFFSLKCRCYFIKLYFFISRFTDAVEARSIKTAEKYYILRPELIESYFVLWRLTKNQKYRDWGWEAVQVIINFN